MKPQLPLIRSKSPQAYTTRGLIRASRGEREAAIADLERSLELGPHSAVAAETRAKLTELRP